MRMAAAVLVALTVAAAVAAASEVDENTFRKKNELQTAVSHGFQSENDISLLRVAADQEKGCGNLASGVRFMQPYFQLY